MSSSDGTGNTVLYEEQAIECDGIDRLGDGVLIRYLSVVEQREIIAIFAVTYGRTG